MMEKMAEKMISEIPNLGEKSGNCKNPFITKKEMEKIIRKTGISKEKLLEKAKEIYEKRTLRAQREAKKPPLRERLSQYLLGAHPLSPVPRATTSTCKSWKGKVIGRNIPQRLWLIREEHIHHYSNRYGDYPVTAAWLAGYDDGYFITRVPSTVETIQQAIKFLQPREVKEAEAKGKRVLRQGDVWFVEQKKDNLHFLPYTHRWNPQTRTVTHHQHGTLHIPYPCLAIPNKRCTHRGIRSGKRTGGD